MLLLLLLSLTAVSICFFQIVKHLCSKPRDEASPIASNGGGGGRGYVNMLTTSDNPIFGKIESKTFQLSYDILITPKSEPNKC